MFWLEQIPTIVLTLLGISLVRNLVLSRWPKIKEGHLDAVLVVTFFVTLFMSWATHNQQAMQDEERQRTINALRDYSVAARLNPLGLTGMAKPPLKERSSLSDTLEGTWVERDGKLVLSCDAPTLEKLRRVVESNPRFPF